MLDKGTNKGIIKEDIVSNKPFVEPKQLLPQDIFFNISKLEPEQKKNALKDVVKLIQVNGAKWVTELMTKRRMVEEISPHMAYLNFKYTSHATIKNAISKDKKLLTLWNNASKNVKNTIADFVVTNALKEFYKEKEKVYWPNGIEVPKGEPEVAQSIPGNSITSAPESPAEKEPGLISKIKGAASSFGAGLKNPGGVAGELLHKHLAPDIIKKGEGGKLATRHTVTGNNDEITSVQPEVAPETPIIPPVTPQAPIPSLTQGDMVKIKALNQNLNASQKVMGMDDAEKKNLQNFALTYGKKFKTDQTFLNAYFKSKNKKPNDPQLNSNPKYINAIKNAWHAMNDGKYITITENIVNIIKEAFIMSEEGDNDAMSNNKEPKSGDMVWFIRAEGLTEKLKDPKALKGKIKFNKFNVEFVDMNEPDKMEVVENIKTLFYEATTPPTTGTPGVTQPTSGTTQATSGTTPPTSGIPTKPKGAPKYFDEKNGTTKVMYMEGPDKGKKMIVKLTDLTLSNDLVISLIQFGYYQGDVKIEKATIDIENKIAAYCHNISHEPRYNLNAKVNPKDIEFAKTQTLYNTVLHGDLQKAFSEIPHNKEDILEFSKQVNKFKEIKTSKEDNTKILHIQKIDFDDKTKTNIISGVVNNKPLTKEYVLSTHKVSNEFVDVQSSLVSRVNYAKGFDWFKALGMTIGTIDGMLSGKFLKTILGRIANWLQGAADTWGDLSGTHKVRNF